MEEKIYQQKENKVEAFLDDAAEALKNKLRSYKNKAYLVYILYATSLIIGITVIVGIVMAYLFRKSAVKDKVEEYIISHFTWQIKTFWGSIIIFLLAIISIITIVLPYIILILGLVWWLYRIIKGWMYLSKEQTIPNKWF
jgi:uncharacterized membrane protein